MPVQGFALPETVALHLVEQRPEAPAETLRGLAAVAAHRLERRSDRLALRRLPGLTEGTAPGPLLLVGAGRGGRAPLEGVPPLRLPIRHHPPPPPGVLPLTHAGPPRLP